MIHLAGPVSYEAVLTRVEVLEAGEATQRVCAGPYEESTWSYSIF